MLIVIHSGLQAQGPPYTVTNPCEPCSNPPADVTNSTIGGWPVTFYTKKIRYGGCTYNVVYKKRICNGYQDVRIEGIYLDGTCANKPTDKGKKTNCEWMKSMQDMAIYIMSELLRENPMLFTTNGWWRVLTPACFEFDGVNFMSPINLDPPAPPSACSKSCCLHVLSVSPDSCGIVRMVEVKPANNGGCPLQLSPQNDKLSSEKDCEFADYPGSYTCIPVCGRKLTELDYGSGPPINIPGFMR